MGFPSWLLAFALTFALLPAATVHATDVDGPDCGREITDFGDAPEGFDVFARVIGYYPTCLAPSAPGTQEVACQPISSPPGPTGFMRNQQLGTSNYWLGCYTDASSALIGIDSETDGKTNVSGAGSFCDPAVIVDCDEIQGSIGQDECDGPADAGLIGGPDFFSCRTSPVFLSTANCGLQPHPAFLNVLADWNYDGDWNDVILCDPQQSTCVYEWAVKNAPVMIPVGCGSITSAPFPSAQYSGTGWMRISLTDVPVDDDFPWAGSANRPGGSYPGGETEDYFFFVVHGDPVNSSTWGGVKIRYH